MNIRVRRKDRTCGERQNMGKKRAVFGAFLGGAIAGGLAAVVTTREMFRRYDRHFRFRLMRIVEAHMEARNTSGQ